MAIKDLYRVDGLPTRVGSQLPASEFEGAVSLEVDLRPSLGDTDALAATMIRMREGTERALASAGR